MAFTCPRCGSAEFGSSQLPDGTLQRLCHGYLVGKEAALVPMPGGGAHWSPSESCGFTWHQSRDKDVGVEPPPSIPIGRSA